MLPNIERCAHRSIYFLYLRAGGVTSIVYSLLVVFDADAEFVGFLSLLISAIAIGLAAYSGQNWGMLFLPFFYVLAGIIGMLRWL